MVRLIATLVFAALLAGSASAENSWVGFKEGRRRAREEHRPIVIFFDLQDGNSELFLKRKFSDSRIQLLAKRFVLVRVTQGARDVWNRYEIVTGPAVLITDSDGKLLERGDWRSANATFHAMKSALRKFGPIISPEARVQADALTAEIKTAMKKKNYGAAAVAAKKLAALTTENPYAERARITFRRLGAMADHHLEKAAAHEKVGSYYEALLCFETIVSAYPGIPEVAEAKKHIARYAKSAKITAIVARQRDEAEAAAALAVAKAKDATRPDLALEKWEALAARWPKTQAGREANRLARFRRADPEAMQQVRESRAKAICPSKLGIAQSYIDNGMPEKAREILESVLKEHAGTSFEPRAKAMLANLK